MKELWHLAHFRKETKLIWIPPGAKARNWRDSDLQRHMGGETK